MVELVALAALLVAAASGEEREAGRGRRVRAYRGTQRSSDRTVRGSASYTPSLGAAVIWSAVPGSWHGEPHLLPSSSVSLVELPADRIFVIGKGSTTSTVGEVVRALQIEDDEVRKIFNYLHNRLLGKARGGEFGYRVVDDDGEEVEEGEVPFSLLHPETLLSVCRDELWHDPSVVDRVTVDAFALADAPAVQRALARNGYDAVAYRDVFQGGTRAARVLLGVDVLDLPGVEESPDLRDEEVPSHLTIRPVDPASVEVLWCRPSAEVVEEVRKELLAPGVVTAGSKGYSEAMPGLSLESRDGITDQDVWRVLEHAAMDGMSGHCAMAAIAINRVFFGGRGVYVVGTNHHLGNEERPFVGHVAVRWEGMLWDAEGQIEDPEDLRAWGMVDPHDPDWAEFLENEDDAYDAVLVDFDPTPEYERLLLSSTDSHTHGSSVEEKEERLRRSAADLGIELPRFR